MADELQYLARGVVALVGSERKKRCGHGIVAWDTAAVRVHPAEAELSFRVAISRGRAIQARRQDLVHRHALAMFVGQGLSDQARHGGALVGDRSAGGECDPNRRHGQDATWKPKPAVTRHRRVSGFLRCVPAAPRTTGRRRP